MVTIAILSKPLRKWQDMVFARTIEGDEEYIIYGSACALDDLLGPSDCQWMIPHAR